MSEIAIFRAESSAIEVRGGRATVKDSSVVRRVNARIATTYWEKGQRLVGCEQRGKDCAGYGESLIARLAEDLTQRFGRGFSRKNLQQMRSFHLAWPAEAICQTPSGKSSDLSMAATRFPLPWSAYVRLLSVKNEAARRVPNCAA